MLGAALAGGEGTLAADIAAEWADTPRRGGRADRRGGSRGESPAEGRDDTGSGERPLFARPDEPGVETGLEPDRSDDRRGRGGRSGRSGRKARRRDDGAEPRAERTERRRGPAQIDPDADPEAAARAICLRLLTGQPRTRAQLADALRLRGVPDEVAAHVLGRFTEVKLIDDAAFANAWVDTRHQGRGLARRALARELRQRGVDAEVVSEAVERLDPDQELATARALVERRLAATRRFDRQVRMRRLAGMLARKGYGEGLALRVVREALDADEADHGHDDEDDAWTYNPGFED
jgi:regulatory protein